MTSETPFHEIERAFHEALERPAESREAWLAELALRSPGVAEEVRALLRADEASTHHLGGDDLSDALDRRPAPGSEFAGFTIEEIIGRGGMGTVYRAAQEEPRRTVAVKILDRVLDGPSRSRFKLETRILARLKHPGIAQIHDAGVENGVPWFAMELVEGRGLREALASRDLETRLRVFVAICNAVHHAHQRGVIHRDLKPGNVLVDESGAPKLLDFGIARVEDDDMLTTAGQTTPGAILGTMAYMSPEQARGDADDVDARTDIYSLGMMLYEMVCDRLPYVLPRSIAAAVQTITGRAPDPMRLDGARRDLETVTLKALEKEPGRRFASAAELGADVERLLRHEPVTARPATPLYHMARFARRHRTAVALAAVALLAIIGGLVASLVARDRADRAADLALARERQADVARRSAETEADKNRELATLLSDLLSSAHPGIGLGRDVRMRDVLAEWSERLRGADHLRPVTQVISLTLLGDTLERLGYYDEACRVLERGTDIAARATASEEDEADFIKVRDSYARALESAGRLEEALRWSNPEHLEGDDRLAALLVRSRILAQLNRADEAEAAARAAALGADSESTAAGLRAEVASTLAAALDARGRNAEAAAVVEAGLEAVREELGDRNPAVIALRCQRLGFLFTEGLGEQAREDVDDVLADARDVLGRRHRQTIGLMQYSVRLLFESGDLEGALAPARRLVATCDEVWTEPTTTSIQSRIRLGVILYRSRELREARRILERALEDARDALGDGASPTLNAAEHLCRTLLAQGALDEACEISAELLATPDLPLCNEYSALVRARSMVLTKTMRPDAAERSLRALCDLIDENEGFNRLERSRALNDLAATLYFQKDFDEAEGIMRRLVAARAELVGPDHPLTITARGNLGALLYRKGDVATAAEVMRETVASAERAEQRPDQVAKHRLVWGIALRELGRLEEAERQLDRTLGDLRAAHGESDSMVGRAREALRRLEAKKN